MADFIKLSDTRFLAVSAIQQVEFTCCGDQGGDPAVCVHLPHGTQEFTGDEAQAVIDHFGGPEGKKHAHKEE